jgi:methylated-DNA-protein-cysteine methyltransferase-like protein
MTYGQIAGLCGNARAARIVGGIAHYGPVSLPWHRVVNRSGGLANGYYGGQEGQKAALVNEGVEVFGDSGDYKVLLETYLWSPNS